MTISETRISGVLIIQPQVFSDERGEFMETFSHQKLENYIPPISFVQDNQSTSKKNVFRGLHFQKPPFAQAKLVRVNRGAAIDYVVDLRTDSKTYGELLQLELSAENQTMLFIPEGMAHGFEALEDNTIFQYKCSSYYAPDAESGILYSSVPGLKLKSNSPIINQKDLSFESLEAFVSPF